MIEVCNLHKSFGDLQVLKGVDLTIKQGEIVFAFENPELLRGYTEEEYQTIMDEMRD